LSIIQRAMPQLILGSVMGCVVIVRWRGVYRYVGLMSISMTMETAICVIARVLKAAKTVNHAQVLPIATLSAKPVSAPKPDNASPAGAAPSCKTPNPPQAANVSVSEVCRNNGPDDCV
jgi:hypothetical protein